MQQKKLPSFLLIGAQKSGTTTLFRSLADNSKIGIPACKEVHFFDSDENYQKGLEFYESFFSNMTVDVIGEATPSYLYMPKCPERIFDTLGSATKFVVSLRHPVDRAYSHYCHNVEKGLEFHKWRDALALEQDRIRKDDRNRIVYSYCDRGHYVRDIKRYLQLFRRENFLFLLYEKDIKKHLHDTILRIDKFLDVPRSEDLKTYFENRGTVPRFKAFDRLLRDPDFAAGRLLRGMIRNLFRSPQFRGAVGNRLYKLNQGAKPSLSTEERNRLFDFRFKEETSELETLTGLNFSPWCAHA